ncbi:MAG: hypothetical protein ROO73_02290 [Roseivirga sp.]
MIYTPPISQRPFRVGSFKLADTPLPHNACNTRHLIPGSHTAWLHPLTLRQQPGERNSKDRASIALLNAVAGFWAVQGATMKALARKSKRLRLLLIRTQKHLLMVRYLALPQASLLLQERHTPPLVVDRRDSLVPLGQG